MAGGLGSPGTLGVGAVPPTRSMIQLAGGQSSSDQTALLQMILQALQALVVSLAPTPQLVIAAFNETPAGPNAIAPTQMLTPWNGLIINLTQGVVGMYLGGIAPGSTPFLTFSTSPNPIYLPLPPQAPSNISWSVLSGPATGVVMPVSY